MKYEFMVALRHLKARKKRTLSIVTWLSITGVALGVTALVSGFSVTTGFEHAFRDKVLGVTSHVFVREYGLRFSGYREVEKQIRSTPGVISTSPMTFNEAMLSAKGGTSGAVIKGIIPSQAAEVLGMDDFMVSGSMLELEPSEGKGLPGVVLGAELARILGVGQSDLVTLVSPLKSLDSSKWKAQPDRPTAQAFRVTGIFSAGFHEYDARLGYMDLGTAQAFFGGGDSILGIEVKVTDPLRAGPIANDIRDRLGEDRFSVLDWRRQNRNLFASLGYQRLAILIVLSVMVILASCNVACILIMLVLERTREIAIMKAMGASDNSILKIFVCQGMVIGFAGTLIGMVFAYALCEGLLANGLALDPKVYGIARLPIIFDPMDYLMAGVGALLITFVATIFPALRGARLHPVDGFREVHS